MSVQDRSSTPMLFLPPDNVRRRIAKWRGFEAEIVQLMVNEPFQYKYLGKSHLLIAVERAERYDGETQLEGLPKSTLHEYSGKLTFIPAGHRYEGWQKPRVLTRVTLFYFDPTGPLLSSDSRFTEVVFNPRLYFFDRDIWETVLKLKREIETPTSPTYAEALGSVLALELVRLNSGHKSAEQSTRGGLAAWQKKRVAEYIEEHLSKGISTAELAEIARLSPFHFSRAFKNSFNVSPHQYHMQRRIEQAKVLLAKPQVSVTDIALKLGFSETSSFTAAFRRHTAHTPSNYRRSLE
jgi:AraC-like DNA-binding protein